MYAMGIPGSPTLLSGNPADTIRDYIDKTMAAISSYISNYCFII